MVTVLRSVILRPLFGAALSLAVFSSPAQAHDHAPPLFWQGEDRLWLDGHLEVAVQRSDQPPGDDDWVALQALEASRFTGQDVRLHFRAKLHNATDTTTKLWLHLDESTLDYIDLTLGGQHWLTGDHLPFDTRPIHHTSFLFPVVLHPGETQALSGWIESRQIRLPMSVWVPSAYLHWAEKRTIRNGLFFATVIVLASLCLVTYGATRIPAYLGFGLFNLAAMLFFLQVFGYGFQYLWPRALGVNYVAGPFSTYLLALSFGWMAPTMLRGRTHQPRLSGVIKGLLPVLVIGGLILAIVAERTWLIQFAIYWLFVVLVLIVAMLVMEIRGGSRRARLFALIWAPMLMAALALLLAWLDWIPYTDALITLCLAGLGMTSLGFFVLLGFQLRQSILRRQKVEQESLELKTAQADRLAQEVAERTQQLAESNRRLRQMALTDPLTGLPNRRQLDDFGELHHRLARLTQARLHAAIFDLDHFKQVNDSYGHPVGDRFLQTVANTLEQVLLTPSTGPRLVARLGGEEFALVCYGLDDAELPSLLEAARDAISRIRIDEAPDVQLTLSVGWAGGQADQPLTQIFRRADQALYRAKDAGRNQVVAASVGD
ncbi:sensor domain-containing diguanylate cyclase [Saccharospirillum mangrovi]|uniref:sensor domain-containing diguanylate cyclase n=1 Tax=Saccharospirillum mangrovi TaxID=2161747 RepID=UPI000D3635BE|nr:diguanylate cyclase [Saccharospirillum mangrovi]